MENNHDIDKTFNEASQSLEEPVTFPGFDKVWAKVEEKLDQKKERKHNKISIWLPYGIAASLLIGSGIFYLSRVTEKANNNQSSVAKNIENPKISSAKISEQIHEIDSVVKKNITKDILQHSSDKLARNESPRFPTPSASSPHKTAVSQGFHQDAVQIAEERSVMDSIRRQNIEEVIATGIKKEKASMNTLASNKKISALNAIADTAEYVYPGISSGFQEKRKEPEIIYKKSSVKAYKPFALNSSTKKLLGEKQDVTSLNNFRPGLSINSVSGTSGSGRVDISVGYQANSQSGNEPIVVIDGTVSDIETLKKLDPEKIDNISVISKENAAGLFSGKANNGIIVVITKEISKTEKLKLKKLLQQKDPQK